jgi:hypothetical protein
MDQSYINANGSEAAARTTAETATDNVIAALNGSNINNYFKLHFKKIFFPVNTIAPGAQDITGWTISVNTFFHNKFPCINKDCILLFTNGLGSGTDAGTNGVAIINAGTESNSKMAHEIGHVLGLNHVECGSTPLNFMETTGGPSIALPAPCQSVAQVDALIFSPDQCARLADQQPVYPNDWHCDCCMPKLAANVTCLGINHAAGTASLVFDDGTTCASHVTSVTWSIEGGTFSNGSTTITSSATSQPFSTTACVGTNITIKAAVHYDNCPITQSTIVVPGSCPQCCAPALDGSFDCIGAPLVGDGKTTTKGNASPDAISPTFWGNGAGNVWIVLEDPNCLSSISSIYWSISNGTFSSSNLVGQTSGYSKWLRQTFNSGACQGTSIHVHVVITYLGGGTSDLDVYIPGACVCGHLTENPNDGAADRDGANTAFNSVKLNVQIQPNPMVDGSSSILLSGGHQYQIEIFDTNGQILKTISKFEGTEVKVDRAMLNPGVHLVKVTADTGEVKTLKLVIL